MRVAAAAVIGVWVGMIGLVLLVAGRIVKGLMQADEEEI